MRSSLNVLAYKLHPIEEETDNFNANNDNFYIDHANVNEHLTFTEANTRKQQPVRRQSTVKAPSSATSSKTRSRIPATFHQDVIELENKFAKDQAFETMNEILSLYKLGVEYYSSKNPETQTDLLSRMQIFLSNTTVIKLMKRGSKMLLRRTSANGNALLKPRRRMMSDNCLTLNSLSKKRPNLDMNFMSVGQALVSDCERKFFTGKMLLEEMVTKQKDKFHENLKMKLYKQKSKLQTGNNNTRQSFIIRKNINPEFNFIVGQMSHSNNNVNSYQLENKLINSNLVGALKKKSFLHNSSKSIVEIVDSYLTRLHEGYWNVYMYPSIDESIQILHEGFQKKKETFEEYIGQSIEVEMMIEDTPNELIKKSYTQLLSSMRLENERELIEIHTKKNARLSEINSTRKERNISEDQVVADLHEDFMNEIVEIFK